MTPDVESVAENPRPRPSASNEVPEDDLDDLMLRCGRGDQRAFADLYDALSPAVYGLSRRVVRDPAQAEEVTQEVFLDVWRSAPRFERDRGAARSWVLTITHRRAVDRVRSAQASTDRELRAAQQSGTRDYDEVVEAVESRLEAQAVRRCLQALTDLQREAVSLAYYAGNTYVQVANALRLPLGTVKTRLRDGLIRLRDCLGVTA
jgi:RNA polymerase sigma-70 factor (ECF subfamily)